MEEYDQPLAPSDDIAEVPEDAVFCFLDQGRPCSADCAAYKTFPEDNKNLEPAQRHCALLQAAERGSRSLNILAGLVNVLVSKQKKVDADAQRAAAFNSAPIPTPMGSKT